jgi:UDP-GlcNAc:undecaprenyl-phosphate GlcNAc-1-phosphate transferase
MASDARTIAAFVAAAALTAVATPVLAGLARRAGILDHPGGYKEHERPTPYLGGVAILLGVLAATLATAGVESPLPAIAAAAAAICLLGTIDDWRPIPPAPRVAVQAAAGAAIWEAGAGWSLALPDWANLVLTVGWVVVATNSLNLIDNLDGTASGAAALSALGITVIALGAATDAWPAYVAAAVLGACVGFLPYNLSGPARIFLGDGGSTLLGFLLAVGVMGALHDASGSVAVVAAVLLLGAPLLDTAVVVISRRRRGVPTLTGGRDHLTHRIHARVHSARGTATIVAVAQGGFSALAVAMVELGLPAVPVVVVMIAAALLLLDGLASSEDRRAALPQMRKAG